MTLHIIKFKFKKIDSFDLLKGKINVLLEMEKNKYKFLGLKRREQDEATVTIGNKGEGWATLVWIQAKGRGSNASRVYASSAWIPKGSRVFVVHPSLPRRGTQSTEKWMLSVAKLRKAELDLIGHQRCLSSSLFPQVFHELLNSHNPTRD